MNPNKRLLLTLLVSLGFNFSPRVHSFAIAPDGVKTDIPLQGDTQNLGSGISNAATIDTAQRGDSVQTLTVVNGNDAGAGSLRQAILDANATAGNDEIRFAPSVKLVTLTTARLDIDTTQGGLSLVAESSGSANVAIERSNANGTSNFSVFHIIGDGAVTMEGLTIRNGRGEMLAGGIVNEGKGTLTLTRSTVSGNRGRYAGGGIYSAGAVTLINSNASDNGGGAIMSSQTVTLINSIVSGNRQSASMRSAIHGREVILTNSTISNNDLNGIFSEEAVSLTSSAVSGNRGSGIFSKGAVSLTNSTVSSNVGKDFGGGIYSDRAVNLTNSTVSGNRAIKGGGGIYSAGGGTITNSTITNNEIVDNERQHGGGGLYASGTTPLAIRNSIIAGNFDLTRVPIDPNIRINTPNFDPTDSKHQFPDVFSANGAIVNGDAKNIVGDPTGAVGTIGTGSDRTSIALIRDFGIIDIRSIIKPLGNYGGSTQTHALVPGGPAIDAGNNSFATGTDQRGKERAVNSAVDIGAFEFQGSADDVAITPQNSPGDVSPGTQLIAPENNRPSKAQTPTPEQREASLVCASAVTLQNIEALNAMLPKIAARMNSGSDQPLVVILSLVDGEQCTPSMLALSGSAAALDTSLGNAIALRIGRAYTGNVRVILQWIGRGNALRALVYTSRSRQPAFLEEQGDRKFYVNQEEQLRALSTTETADYIRQQWPNR